MSRPGGFKPALVYFLLLVLTTRTIARNWNDQARVATVDSLVERHTFAIDGSIFRETGDKVLIDGRFYSNKPPVMDVAGAALFLPVHEAFGVSLSKPRSAGYYLLTLLLIGVPSALGVALLDRWFRRRGFAPKDRLLALAGFGCATLVWPYSTVINNHTLGGVLLLLGVLLLAPASRSGNRRTLLGALALGFSATIDLPPAAIFAVVFLAYVLLRRGVRTGAWYLAGLAPPLLLQVALQLAISGDVLPVNLHREYWDFPGSPWIGTPISGQFHFASIGEAVSDVFHSLLGSRGFFSYSPFLIVGTAGLVAAAWSRRGEERGYARATLLAVTLSLAYLVVFGTDFGGLSYGERYLVTLSGVLVAFTPKGWWTGATTPRRALLAAALAVSVFIAGLGVLANPWRARTPVEAVALFDRGRLGPSLRHVGVLDLIPPLRRTPH